jgi:hypothetical protein
VRLPRPLRSFFTPSGETTLDRGCRPALSSTLELKARLELLRFVLMSGLVGGLVFGSPGAGVAGSIIGLTLWVLLQDG